MRASFVLSTHMDDKADPTSLREPTPAVTATPANQPFDPDLVRKIVTMLAESDLTEIEVETGDFRIRVARSVTMTVAAAPAAIPIAAPSAPTAPAAQTPDAAHPDALTSPMVGTAYRRPAPGSKAFVEIGSEVRAGDKLLLIEAMKTFNDIVAHRSGTVRAIYVEDGHPVEYGEPLMLIE